MLNKPTKAASPHIGVVMGVHWGKLSAPMMGNANR